MYEILIVDDERVVRESLRELLDGEGYSIRTARNGIEAVKKFSERKPDLVLLDVMMPRMNGFVTCEQIRALDPLVPLLFLTAKDAGDNELRGLGAGADDFISKTASDENLLARIRRALSRSAAVMSSLERCRHTLSLGKVSIDFDLREITDDDGVRKLTEMEANVLRCLAERRGEVLSLDEIFTRLHGEGYAGVRDTIRIYVMNLRRKLGCARDMICSVYNGGYYLVR